MDKLFFMFHSVLFQNPFNAVCRPSKHISVCQILTNLTEPLTFKNMPNIIMPCRSITTDRRSSYRSVMESAQCPLSPLKLFTTVHGTPCILIYSVQENYSNCGTRLSRIHAREKSAAFLTFFTIFYFDKLR